MERSAGTAVGCWDPPASTTPMGAAPVENQDLEKHSTVKEHRGCGEKNMYSICM